ncbi:unnamed protein product, partial [Amoebophrya sp. A25]
VNEEQSRTNKRKVEKMQGQHPPPTAAMAAIEGPIEGEHAELSAPDSDPSTESEEDLRSRFKTLPPLHPHEVELRVPVTELSRPIAPEKFRSKISAVGGFVFGLLIFPRGTKSGRQEGGKAGAGRQDPPPPEKGETRWISAFVEARPSEDYPPNWFFQDVQFLVSLINHTNISNSIVKHDKHTFSPTESSDGKAIDRGWHDFVSCDEGTLRNGGFVDPRDDTVCFRASVYLAGGPMKVNRGGAVCVRPRPLYGELQKWNDLSNSMLPTFVNSLTQIWFHLGAFRSIFYQAERAVVEQVAAMHHKQMTKSGAITDRELPESAYVDERGNNSVLLCFREIFGRLQSRQGLASAARVSNVVNLPKRDLEHYVKGLYEMMLMEVDGAGSSSSSSQPTGPNGRRRVPPATVGSVIHRELQRFMMDVEWSETPICGQDKTKSQIRHQTPIFPLLIRGFSNLEQCLDHYFSAKVLDDGDGSRVQAKRSIKYLPPVLFWSLKRGQQNPTSSFEFPRKLNMTRYMEPGSISEADAEYAL